MNRILITGASIVSPAGIGMDTLKKALTESNTVLDMPFKIPKELRAKKARGVDRYASLAIAAVKELIVDNSISQYDPYDIGTLMTTEFGPMQTNLKFLGTLYEYSSEYVSPKQFSSTVANVCLGQVCIEENFKGFSTMLINSHNLPVAASLIKNGATKVMITGGVDAFEADLFQDLLKFEDTSGDAISLEGACMLKLESDTSDYLDDTQIMAELVAWSDMVVSHNDKEWMAYGFVADDFLKSMRKAIESAGVEPSDIGIVYMCNNGNESLQQQENTAVDQLFGEHVAKSAPNRCQHHLYSVSNNLLTGLAAMALKENAHLIVDQKDNTTYLLKKAYSYALVNTINIDGAVSTIILKRYE